MMNNIKEIRREYDLNYYEICQIIEAMGGQKYLYIHKINRTKLYHKLLKLQKKEHWLNDLENNYLESYAIDNEFELYIYA